MRPEQGSDQARGKIKIVRGPYTDSFCAELTKVPDAQNDDWADALALAYLAGSKMAGKFRVTTGRRERATRF